MKERTKKFFKVWLTDLNKTIQQRKETSLEDVEKWFSWIMKDAKILEGEE